MSLVIGAGVRVIQTPAGLCPVKLEGTSIEEVQKWANAVVEHGRQNNLTYLPSALIYFCQQFYRILTPEYEVVKNNIEEMFGGKLETIINKNINIENLKKQEDLKEETPPVAQKEDLQENPKKKEDLQENPKKKRGRPPKK